MASPDTKQIGLIGLGLMGSAFAGRWLAAGWRVLGFDIDSARCAEFNASGGECAANATGVFMACERIVFSLPTSETVDGVLREAGGALRRGQVIIDTTTGSPADAERFGRELEARGVTYFDATISGNSAQVQSGDVLVMVGGPEAVFAECHDVFEGVASRTIHVGSWGGGSRMKLVTNLVLGLNRAALAEGLILARVLGLDTIQALDVLRSSMAYSRMMDVKGEKMIHGDFAPQARLSQHLKDVCLMLDAGERAGQPLPLTSTHRDVLAFAASIGLGDLDNSAIIEALARYRATTPEPEA